MRPVMGEKPVGKSGVRNSPSIHCSSWSRSGTSQASMAGAPWMEYRRSSAGGVLKMELISGRADDSLQGQSSRNATRCAFSEDAQRVALRLSVFALLLQIAFCEKRK